MIKFDLNQQNVFVISDTHAYHKNICRGTSEWSDKSRCRDFTTIGEMNYAILSGINQHVMQDDILIHLGDWSFGGINNIWEFRKQINCKNIYLCYGNHDQHIKVNKVLPNAEKDYDSYRDGVLQFVDKPSDNKSWIDADRYDVYFGEVNAQELFTYTDHILEFEIEKNTLYKQLKLQFFCSHYAHRIWPDSHKGVYHLYGHSHSTLEYEPYGKSMDVGIDNAYRLFGEYRPFNIMEVYDLLRHRNIKLIDGHGK